MSIILQTKNLSVQYHKKKQTISAVHSFHMQLRKGQIVCIVGESGSGKTSLIHALIRILPPYTTVMGEAYFQQLDLLRCDEKRLNQVRGKELFYLSQHPEHAFHPTIKISKQLYEIIGRRIAFTKKEFFASLISMLHHLHFQKPEVILKQYPFQLSGGMLQRLHLACAFLLKPQIIIADEPTSSLDTDVQKQILAYMRKSAQNLSISYVIVTHDLGVVAEIADVVIVMKDGQKVEENEVHAFFNHPQTNYTKMLLQTEF